MKKTFLMAAFAALAMVFATSCEKEDTDTEDTGNYPESLVGYWIPVDANQGGDSYIMIGETNNGKAECTVHIEGAPVDPMLGYVTYDAKTGAGTFELDAATAERLPELVVKVQAKDKDLMSVSRSLDGGKQFMSADFKRVEKPNNGGNENGGENGGENGNGDTVANSWPETPLGNYTAYAENNIGDSVHYGAMIREEDGVYKLYIWAQDEDNFDEYVFVIEYDPATGNVNATLTEVGESNEYLEEYIPYIMTVMQFINEDSFFIQVAFRDMVPLEATFERFDAAGKK